MIIVINRPEQCPFRSRGCKADLCGYPADKSPLHCDTHPNAIAKDKFPLMCPLRENESKPQEEYNNAIRYL